MKNKIIFIFYIVVFLVSVLVTQAAPLSSSPNKKVIALTFDDGPYGTSTREILGILKKKQVHATFFLIGKNIAQFPDMPKEIIKDGNIIGNHTYSHSKYFTHMSKDDFLGDVEKAEHMIETHTQVKPLLFRPPYGKINLSMKKELIMAEYTNVLWNVDPRDWDLHVSALQIEQRVIHQTKPDSIIILHDGHESPLYPRDQTVLALPHIIDDLKKEGYSFVTVDQLLSVPAYKNN